jgi:methylmalonyl-CoA mutase N-terminal domain/subunit
VDRGERVMVGVNRYQMAEGDPIPRLRIDEEVQRGKISDLARLKAERDAAAVERSLAAVRAAASGSDNLMPPIIDAAKAYCTEQEICDVLREVMGTHSDRGEF